MSNGAVTDSFSDAERTGTYDFAGQVLYARDEGDGVALMRIADNLSADAATELPLELRYLSYGQWIHNEGTGAEKNYVHFLLGYPTVASDMPRSGSANYATFVRATRLIVGSTGSGGSESPLAGTATFGVNFATGAIDTSLSLVVPDVGGSRAAGTFNGTGIITTGTSSFTGTFTSPDTALTGDFTGAFFGPAAEEMGYAFGLNGQRPANPLGDGHDYHIVGTVVGKKQ